MLEHRCLKCDKLLATSLSIEEIEKFAKDGYKVKKETLTIKCPRCKEYNEVRV